MHAPDPHAWLGIELRHLAALQAVAEEQSFVRAGKRLGYTQSAISNQIATLERLVGSRLVERARGGSSVSLTPTGKPLYEHATAIMARLQAARTDVAALQSDQGAVLRVGYFQSIGPIALPRVAAAFRTRAPSVRLELELGDAEQLLQEVVAAGSLDVAFVSAPVRLEALDSLRLVDDPFVLLSPPGDGQPDFSTRPLLTYKPCSVQLVHEATLERTHGLPPDRLVRLEDAATIQALVAAGSAYALLPSLAVTATEPRLDVLEGPRREIHLVWQRDRSATDTLQLFLDATKATFATIGTQPWRNAA